ncbi:4-hydroxybenzoate polyprenyltransferase [Sinobaca qinghaiensis]|uniref:4-hydroxybenzoate polyprenyltransferase n=1 Tax=Sinobaca qinghaiensis TaxID=342944 RepID=A0A419V2W4_9BACL|nr:UbiA-like polyprenyltransferase [Sinobaca qinghaiensis]RKD72859.1 4-hydroxybenzoate polyprenyltransferase [Sinobaca qinghaiensis]
MKKIKVILEMIKFEHTVFALPFAFLGAVLGSMSVQGTWPTIMEWIFITLAMVGARSAAMTLNRVIDANIDKKNPRTADRAIPAGEVSIAQSLLFIGGSFALLFIAAFSLNTLTVLMLPLFVFLLTFYSYTKRFTWLCHVFLGVTIAMAPVGGWIGATGQFSVELLFLFLTVAFWTAGFDVIYATQDAEYDRRVKLHSIPARFGIEKALRISKGFHLISFASLLLLSLLSPLGWLFFIGVMIVGAIMVYEHSLVKPNDLTKVGVAFFQMNGIISITMLVFAIGDLLL